MSDENTELDAIFSGEHVEPAEPPAEAPEQEAGAPEASDPTPEEPPAPAPAEPNPEIEGLKRALREERMKRQEFEWRLQQAQQPKQAPPDIFDKPDEVFPYVERQVQERLTQERLDISEAIARDKHGDDVVEAALEAIHEAAQRPEGVATYQQIMTAKLPYEALVKWHNAQVAAREIGDPAAYRAKLEAEIRDQVRREMAQQALEQARATVPPSLAGATGTGGNRAPSTGPTPLSAIFKA